MAQQQQPKPPGKSPNLASWNPLSKQLVQGNICKGSRQCIFNLSTNWYFANSKRPGSTHPRGSCPQVLLNSEHFGEGRLREEKSDEAPSAHGRIDDNTLAFFLPHTSLAKEFNV